METKEDEKSFPNTLTISTKPQWKVIVQIAALSCKWFGMGFGIGDAEVKSLGIIFKRSTLHWIILVLFCGFFVQWSIFPSAHLYSLEMRKNLFITSVCVYVITIMWQAPHTSTRQSLFPTKTQQGWKDTHRMNKEDGQIKKIYNTELAFCQE